MYVRYGREYYIAFATVAYADSSEAVPTGARSFEFWIPSSSKPALSHEKMS